VVDLPPHERRRHDPTLLIDHDLHIGALTAPQVRPVFDLAAESQVLAVVADGRDADDPRKPREADEARVVGTTGEDPSGDESRAVLDIHARTPPEIALSIVAELVAERRRPAVAPPPAPEPVLHARDHGAHCHP